MKNDFDASEKPLQNSNASGLGATLIPEGINVIGMHAASINNRFSRLQEAERQIEQALAVLKDAKRFECLPFDGDGVHREECEYGNCVDADLLDRLLDIFGE